jgi:hypothetical protein
MHGSSNYVYRSLCALQKQQARARRQRIPAFGEWNYSYGGDWPVTQYFDSAMQAGLVPPSPMPVKKVAELSLDIILPASLIFGSFLF